MDPTSVPTSTGPTDSVDESTPRTGTDDGPVDFPEMTVDLADPYAVEAAQVINDALLTPKDAGKGFVKGNFVPADPTNHDAVLPCGQPSTAAMFPNGLRLGTQIGLPDTAQLEQTVNLFLDEETAKAAFAWSADGLNCNTGDLNGTAIEITDEGDVTADVGGDEAHAWTAVIGGQNGVVIGVRRGHMTLGFTFIVAAGADGSALPNPVELAALGMEKLAAAGY